MLQFEIVENYAIANWPKRPIKNKKQPDKVISFEELLKWALKTKTTEGQKAWREPTLRDSLRGEEIQFSLGHFYDSSYRFFVKD